MVTIGHMGKRFGERLQEAIDKAGITKYRLAKDTGISQVQIGRLVSGDREPTPEAVEKIAPILGTAITEMQAWADADRLGDERLRAVQEHVVSPQMTVDEWADALRALPHEEQRHLWQDAASPLVRIEAAAREVKRLGDEKLALIQGPKTREAVKRASEIDALLLALENLLDEEGAKLEAEKARRAEAKKADKQ